MDIHPIGLRLSRVRSKRRVIFGVVMVWYVFTVEGDSCVYVGLNQSHSDAVERAKDAGNLCVIVSGQRMELVRRTPGAGLAVLFLVVMIAVFVMTGR